MDQRTSGSGCIRSRRGVTMAWPGSPEATKMKRLEGNIWVRLESNRRKRYYYRKRTRFFENGVRKYKDERRSLGTNLGRAQQETARLDSQLDDQMNGKAARREATLGTFIDWYVVHIRDERKLLSWKTMRINVTAFLNSTGDRPLRSISTNDVVVFLSRRKLKVRPTTVNSNLRDVRRMLTVAVEQGYLESNPAAVLKPVPAKPQPMKIPTREEAGRLLDYLKNTSPWLHILVIFLLGTGCRLGEALALNWADVEMTRDVIILRRRKVQDELRIQLSGPLREMLWGLWHEHGMPKEGTVFQGPSGLPLGRHTAFSAFKRTALKLGWPWLTLKTMRRTAATHVVESTGSIRNAQMLLGHTSAQTTEMYLGRGEKARETALETMAGYLEGATEVKVGPKMGTTTGISTAKSGQQITNR